MCSLWIESSTPYNFLDFVSIFKILIFVFRCKNYVLLKHLLFIIYFKFERNSENFQIKRKFIINSVFPLKLRQNTWCKRKAYLKFILFVLKFYWMQIGRAPSVMLYSSLGAMCLLGNKGIFPNNIIFSIFFLPNIVFSIFLSVKNISKIFFLSSIDFN